ncbi:MAG: septal ring lytic transglycosylase RlpA family protein [Colwellia sp.]
MKIKNTIFLLTLVMLLNACSTGRYQQANDSTPTRLPSKTELKDAIARAEPHSRGGNKHYQVRGKSYQVLATAENFEQIGTASWYGKKFHGHLTSNGEIYDMYSMSAAHKNLPLPTYVKVTNLANNKSVIVRVNDRGPFHQSRIIDLSYSAAYKLDMLKTGTAHVKVTAITDFSVNKQEKQFSKKQYIHKNYIQVFATRKQALAKSTAHTLTKKYQQTVNFPKHGDIYKVQMGPITNIVTLNKILQSLKKSGYPNAYRRNL